MASTDIRYTYLYPIVPVSIADPIYTYTIYALIKFTLHVWMN